MTAKEQIIPALLQSLQNMNTTHEQRIYGIKKKQKGENR